MVFLLFFFVLSANFFDATSTLALHSTGNYYEVNPFVRVALSVSHDYFLFWKVVSMSLMVGLVSFLSRTYRVFWWSLLACVGVYACLTIYYLYHLFLFTP